MSAGAPSLEALQRSFAAALVDGDERLAAWVVDAGIEPAARLRIYRNAVLATRVDTLAGSFPALRAWVGEACFDGLATRHAARRGHASGNLQTYGADFPPFVAEQPELAGYPWLGDLARLEWLRQVVLTAAEPGPVDAMHLIGALEREPPTPVLRLQPHVRVFSAGFAVLALWHRACTPGAADAVAQARTQNVLIWRDGERVAMCEVEPGTAAFAAALTAGEDAAAALLAAGAPSDRGGLARILRPLLEHELLGLEPGP